MFDYPFSLQELISVTRNLKTRSSPGYDRIDNRMLSLLPAQTAPSRLLVDCQSAEKV